MSPDIKKQWVAALRSGKYKQGHGYLKYKNTYCCLGVLCDLAVKSGTVTEDDAFLKRFVLSECVMKWAGLEKYNSSPRVKDGVLVILNDGGPAHPIHTFNEIADLIEQSNL